MLQSKGASAPFFMLFAGLTDIGGNRMTDPGNTGVVHGDRVSKATRFGGDSATACSRKLAMPKA